MVNFPTPIFASVKYLLSIMAFIICFKTVVPFMDYLFNYEYISKVLCVNRDKPQLNCDGKCYLMQQLAQNTDSGEEGSMPPIEQAFFLGFYQDFSAFAVHSDTEELQRHLIGFREAHYPFNYVRDFLKPPMA